MKTWILAIPFEDWPQQTRLNGQLRPAMVADEAWHGFAGVMSPIEKLLLPLLPGRTIYNRLLSVVMPGGWIEPHTDTQPGSWLTRVHVPIVSNDQAWMILNDEMHHPQEGQAYFIDTRVKHEVRNLGFAPRIHFMFDVRS